MLVPLSTIIVPLSTPNNTKKPVISQVQVKPIGQSKTQNNIEKLHNYYNNTVGITTVKHSTAETTCFICGKQYSHTSSLSRHKRIEHKVDFGKVTCSICDERSALGSYIN